MYCVCRMNIILYQHSQEFKTESRGRLKEFLTRVEWMYERSKHISNESDRNLAFIYSLNLILFGQAKKNCIEVWYDGTGTGSDSTGIFFMINYLTTEKESLFWCQCFLSFDLVVLLMCQMEMCSLVKIICSMFSLVRTFKMFKVTNYQIRQSFLS